MSESTNSASSAGSAGKWFLCLIGVSIISMGLLFGWLLLRSYLNASATREWNQSEAVILRSVVDQRQIKGSPAEFRLNLLYGYDYEGNSYTSNKLSPRGAKWGRSEEVVTALAKEYPAESTHTVWLNPLDPREAILQHDTKAAGYTIWFPILFVVAGSGMIWGVLGGANRAK
ncbi:MAG: DUF3592 domain-containing protein [Akkermansiaceae bacterium]